MTKCVMTKMTMTAPRGSVFQSFSCKTWFWLRPPTVFSFLTSNPSSSHLSCPESSSESETGIFFLFFAHPTLQAFLSSVVVNNPHQVCAALHWLGFTNISSNCLACMSLMWHYFVWHCIAPFYWCWSLLQIAPWHHSNIAPCPRALLSWCSSLYCILHHGTTSCQRWR